VSASGFNDEQLYIFYETFLPEGWTYEDFNDYESMGVQRDEASEFNKRYYLHSNSHSNSHLISKLHAFYKFHNRHSSTQISQGSVETSDDLNSPEST
jgi:hypothetical protein